MSLLVVTVTPAVTLPTAPVTLPIEPERSPVIFAINAVVMEVAAFVPAINRPPVPPAVTEGRKSVLTLIAAVSTFAAATSALTDAPAGAPSRAKLSPVCAVCPVRVVTVGITAPVCVTAASVGLTASVPVAGKEVIPPLTAS